MGLFMLWAWHNAIFTVLPYRYNGQAALKISNESETQCFACSMSSLQTQIKVKARYVTNFTCILSENHGHSALCISVSSKSVFKKYVSVIYFCWIYGSFGYFLAIWRVWWQISKEARVSHLKRQQWSYLSQHLYQHNMILRLRIWLQKFIKNGHF